MLRKMMAIGAMAMVVVSAACNSVTGPAAGVEGTNGGRPSGQPRDQEVNKVCLDDLRAVSITSPIEGQILHNGQIVLVSLDVDQFCSGFSAAIEVSTDGGRSFQELASGRSLSSVLWKLPQLDNLAPVVRVRAWDNIGSVEDELATGFLYTEPTPTKRDQQRN
jgi:hypothetical protein